MWSKTRLPDRLQPTDFSENLEALRERAGSQLYDLTLSNPTVDFPAHRRRMARCLERAADRLADQPYRPVAQGLTEARRAVCAYYDERGEKLGPEDLVLTASTSEAYTWLAKCFADPGAEILVPTPSYPLFEHLLRVESLQTRSYRFEYDGAWHLDVGDLRRRLEACERPAAIFCVSPNNPTGHTLTAREFDRLARLSRRYELPLVVDEVFLDYPLGGEAPGSALGFAETSPAPPLTFVLSGLSKVAGLPGAKLGWLAVKGREELRQRAIERLSFIADTFLSVSSLTQLATAEILASVDRFHSRVCERTAENLAQLDDLLDSLPACTRYPSQAGWYAVVRIPSFIDEASFVTDLLDRRHVGLQPGFFYDLRPDSHLVVSLLPSPDRFAEGAARLVDALREST